MRSRSRWLGLLLFGGLATSAVVASAASAVLVPGAPLETAAGVPGHGRVWEVVTPEDVSSAYLVPTREEEFPSFVSGSGEQVIYRTVGLPLEAPKQEAPVTWNVATRSPSGWVSSWANVPYPDYFPFLEDVSSDLGETLWWGEPNSQAEAGIFRSLVRGPFTTVASGPYGSVSPPLGTSEDLGRVFFISATGSLLEADDSGVHRIDVENDGDPISECPVTVIRPESSGESPPGTVSADGRRVFFTASLGTECGFPRQAIFLREAGSKTVAISASQCDLADCGAESNPVFLGASTRGSSAFLITTQRLTDDDTDSADSLYRYGVASGKLTLLGPMPVLREFIRDVTPSPDGSRLYFVEEKGQETNLFVADGRGVREVAPIEVSASSPLQVSANGRFAAFVTSASLEGRDTDPAADVYRYDAETGNSTLVSAGPTGGDGPAGASFFNGGGSELRLPPNRPAMAMSGEGSEIFFGTRESLVPEDDNGVDDVYEWNEGSLALVSSGSAQSGESGAGFLGLTPDGSTAFFQTADTLVPRDRDGGELDIYAARIGGGFPEPTPTPGCQDETCRTSSAPSLPRPLARSAERLKRIEVGKLSAAARRRAAATATIELLVEVPRSGTLRVTAKAKVGGRSRIVARAREKVSSPGPLRLRMRLSRPARAMLADGGSLRLRLRLRVGHGVPPASARLDLGGRR